MAQSDLRASVGASPAGVDFDDIQGILRFAHRHLTEASFILLRIADPAVARDWLRAAPVTGAAASTPLPDTALHVAFTREGLRSLGLPDDVIAGFSDEFIQGMTGDEDRAHRLGDVGANNPERWRWGGPGAVPHVLLLLYARTGGLAAWTEAIKGRSWATAFGQVTVLTTAALRPSIDGLSREPFGFVDGISQPEIDWQLELPSGGPVLTYRNRSALGEFVLGYPNEYGKYTDRPLIHPARDPENILPAARDVPTRRDLGRNGSYLVLRDLQQDVPGFWRYLDHQASAVGLRTQQLAEAMVGRTMSGTPLVPLAERSTASIDAGGRLNGFTFQADPLGALCPLGAHIRRANPRNADMPDGTSGWLSQLIGTLGFGTRGPRDDLIASTRFHRLVRRGRSYGTMMTMDQALAADASNQEVGLRFVSLNANITRQFEFVQGAWLTSTKFGGLTGEGDPLLGARRAIAGCPFANTFSIPQPSGAAFRLRDIPQFVTVRGGAYFFLPSLRGLRYIASLQEKCRTF